MNRTYNPLGYSRAAPSRRQVNGAGAAVKAGAMLGWPARLATAATQVVASDPAAVAACNQDLTVILNSAYAAERCAVVLYYTALTTPALLQDSKLAGSTGNLTHVGRDGSRENCANLQAALDQERIHARILAALGAVPLYDKYYFPASTFAVVGHTTQQGTFLNILDYLETAVIAGYLTVIRNLGGIGRADIAAMCARNLAVECEHRALYRLIADDDPPNNMTFPVTEFPCLSDALAFLRPLATGRGFAKGVLVTPGLHVPSDDQMSLVVGNHGTQ